MGRKSREKQERRKPAQWTKFQPATMVGHHQVTVEGETFKVFMNSRYTVLVRRLNPPGWPEMFHLSIKRNDKLPIHDWRDLQRCKNEVLGPDHEAVELYPAESRLVDGANQYHLWALAKPGLRFPFGYRERLVSESNTGWSVQRPFEPDNRPADLREVSDAEMAAAKRRSFGWKQHHESGEDDPEQFDRLRQPGFGLAPGVYE